MFPNGHSVSGEKDYLSPLDAVLEAWKLRGEVLDQDFERYPAHSALRFCVQQNFTSSGAAVACDSQKPRDVRRFNRRVHFDDYIEFATSAAEECEIFHTFVT